MSAGPSTFTKYEFRDLDAAPIPKKKPDEPSYVVGATGVQEYREPHFSTKRDGRSADAILKKGAHFHLDSAVADQLGVGERERNAAEARILKEIELRWEKTSEKAEVNGYTKGLEEGKLEAYQAELPRIKEKVEKLDYLLRELDGYKEKIYSVNEAFLMDLIAQVAGMVALKEVSLDPDYVRRLVTALLHQIGQRDDLKIFLSNADHANADALFQSLQKEFGKLSNTVIEASEDIPVGGCRIETRSGVVDASVATQIENVMRSIKA